MSSGLADHLETLLKNALADLSNKSISHDYQASFAEEGGRKIQFILDDLGKLKGRSGESLRKFVAVSIGGADGSDLESLLTRSDVSRAYLIEFSTEGAEAARAKRAALSKLGKSLTVFEGDAGMRFVDLKKELQELKRDSEACGVLLMLLGVLHELPTRSPDFDERAFIAQFIDIFDQSLIYINEPSVPEDWPDFVELSFEGVSSDLLLRFSEYIRVNVWKRAATELPPPPKPLAAGYVRLRKDLAMEVIFKAVREHDPQRHQYEMGERLSSTDATRLLKLIRSFSPNAEVQTLRYATGGFQAAYAKAGTRVRDAIGNPVVTALPSFQLVAHIGLDRSRTNAASATTFVAAASPVPPLPKLLVDGELSSEIEMERLRGSLADARYRAARAERPYFLVELDPQSHLARGAATLDAAASERRLSPDEQENRVLLLGKLQSVAAQTSALTKIIALVLEGSISSDSDDMQDSRTLAQIVSLSLGQAPSHENSDDNLRSLSLVAYADDPDLPTAALDVKGRWVSETFKSLKLDPDSREALAIRRTYRIADLPPEIRIRFYARQIRALARNLDAGRLTKESGRLDSWWVGLG